MTYSILARCPDTGRLGVAVASCCLAVGARIPLAEAGVGVVVAQAGAWLHWRQAMLETLRQHNPNSPGTPSNFSSRDAAARTAVKALTGHPDAAASQLAALGTTGAPAVWTGPDCEPESGHATSEDVAVQANTMLDPDLPATVLNAYLAHDGPFEERLVAALRAGDAVGADYRGRQSASLTVVSPERGYVPRGDAEDPTIDLRVDDSRDPLAELERLVRVHRAHRHVLAGSEEPDLMLGWTQMRAAAQLAPADPLIAPVNAMWAAMAGDHAAAVAAMRHAADVNPQAWTYLERSTRSAVARGSVHAPALARLLAEHPTP